MAIGNLTVGKSLLDLRASINLMSLSMLKTIGNVKILPTKMAFQLVGRSTKHPYGMVEDLLAKVDKFYFSVDFVIVDIEEDSEVPLMIGKSLMKIAKVIIYVDDGKFKVRVEDDEMNFIAFEALKYPTQNKECFRMDVLEKICMDSRRNFLPTNHLGKVMMNIEKEIIPRGKKK